MQTGIIQPKTETTLKTAPRMRSLAVEFDCIGRILAFPIARIGFAGTMTRRHLTSIRIVILLAMLALVMVGMILGICPVPRRSFLPVFFGALTAPVALSIVERIRTES